VSRHRIQRVCVYCGSSAGRREAYGEAAERFGAALAAARVGLVYGGGGTGMMGRVAAAVTSAGGEATGIIPRHLVERERADASAPGMRVVDSMHERKALMAELADAFVALPGGLGTVEELFEVLTWSQLGMHSKPCGALNACGYFDWLEAFLERAIGEGFMRSEHRGLLLLDSDPERLLERLCASGDRGS